MRITCEKISKRFLRARQDSNVFYAVQETNFELVSGALSVVFGRSGGGKSTLLNMVCGLLEPTSGTVWYTEEELEGSDDRLSVYAMSDEELSSFRSVHIGVVPQGQTALFSLDVTENVLLPLRLYGVDKKDPDTFAQAVRYAKELLELVGIADLAYCMPAELSGGEMRRMAIARALIRRPQLVCADEPTGDLDDANSEIVLSLLRRVADEGAAVMLVTHEPAATGIADAAYVMDGGILSQA